MVTNLAVVDLSPYGFVFQVLALQTLILNKLSSLLFFYSYFFCYKSFCTSLPSSCSAWFSWGVPPGIITGADFSSNRF